MSQGPEVGDVGAALHVSTGLLPRRMREAPVQGDLTLPEMSALARLDRAASATPGEMAKAEQISPQAMGATLGALEERGLIERRPDPGDGRRAVMSLTAAGRGGLRHKRHARTGQPAGAPAAVLPPPARAAPLAA